MTFLTVKIHYICSKYKLRDFVLKTLEVTEGHTGVNTANRIMAVLKEFYVGTNKGNNIWINTDAAPNKRKTERNLGFPHILCFTHKINNVLTKSEWFKQDHVSDLTSQCRGLIKRFRSTARNTCILFTKQKDLGIP